MVGRRRKIKKKHWPKRFIAVPKKKRLLNQNINYLKSHIWNFFWKQYSVYRRCSGRNQRSFFLISKFLAESLRNNKTSKKDHTFYNTVSLKKPQPFLTHLIMKIICLRTQPKTFLALQIFQQTCFVWCQKEYLHCIIS